MTILAEAHRTLNSPHMEMKVEAAWSISLDVECPHCKADFDLTDGDDFWACAQPGEHGTDRTTDLETVCPKCDGQFLCTFVY